MHIKHSVILLISSSILACAGAPNEDSGGAPERDSRRGDCIFESTVRGYSVLDESNLIVSASGRRNYHVVLSRRAWGLDSSWGIAFDSPTGRVCAGFSEVVFNGHLDADKVRIASIRELNEDEHESLLIRYGKREPEIEHTPAPVSIEGAEVEELDPAADKSSGN